MAKTSTSLRRSDEGREALRERLQAKGYHLTRQRMAVYQALSRIPHHPTAEEVFLAVKKRLPRISLATVYKNLEALVQCGAAAKLTYGGDSARYDIRTDHHDHVRCLRCGKIWDIEPRAGSSRVTPMELPKGFQVLECRVEFVGYCRSCRR